MTKKLLVFTTKSFFIISKPSLTWRKFNILQSVSSSNRITSTHMEKIYHRSYRYDQVFVLIIPDFNQNKKAPTGTFFTHLISQSTIANIMAVEAIWQIKLTQIRIHIILRLDYIVGFRNHHE